MSCFIRGPTERGDGICVQVERESGRERGIGFLWPQRLLGIFSSPFSMTRTLPGLAVAAALFLAVVMMPAVAVAQAPAPAPTSDGTSVDQCIACLLMVVALVLTYLIHPLDASSPYKLF